MKNADSEKENKISAIEIENLTKDFRVGMRGVKLRAVDNVSFFVNPGEIFGLLGPNGSGKSTTLKIILGLLRPTSGECRIFGKKSSDISVRSRIGFLPEAPYFYGYLTGRELVKYYARMSGVPAQKIEEATEDALALTGMTAAAARRVKTYSKGMLQRIGVAQAVVHNPDLVILDEPTAGIDPIGSAEIGDAIRTMKSRGKTVVLCSHLLGQIEELCDRVAIMNRGKLSVAGTLDEVLTQRDKQLAVIGNGTPLTPELCSELRERYGIRIERVSQPRISLEKYFLENLKK
ncbi:MAG: ABC transporter ATP-binding protein [Opitutales bacterium]|nr:ABC transporter ATP-binding protein [Opitutales bacterium]